jgi:hypothetical protein
VDAIELLVHLVAVDVPSRVPGADVAEDERRAHCDAW